LTNCAKTYAAKYLRYRSDLEFFKYEEDSKALADEIIKLNKSMQDFSTADSEIRSLK